MINIEEVLKIHEILIDKFGGKSGIRDKSSLESAISRPFQTFDKKELYPNPIEKSAALIESIIKNHPFIDGNKRLGYVLMRLLLMENGLDIEIDEESKYRFVIQIAKGDLKFDEICDWIKNNIE